jgi:hypothetical protein
MAFDQARFRRCIDSLRATQPWGLAFLTMLPVVVFVSPFIQRCVLALTISTADGG